MAETLYWREPAWLLLACYPLLLVLWRRWHRRRVLAAYADAELLPWVTAPAAAGLALRWRGAALGLCWLLLCAALAGPRLPLQLPPGLAPPPARLMAVIDLSRSMSADDVLPDRRGRAVALLRGWLEAERLPAIGLVLYAGRAHLYLPPTGDRRILRRYLDQLARLRLPTLGNDLAGALRLAAGELSAGPGAVLLLSDGDLGPAQRAAAEAQVAALQRSGIALRVLGIGGQGASPLRDQRGDWLLEDDKPVLSGLDEDWLRRLAADGGGRYLADGRIAPDALWSAPAARIAAKDRQAVLWHELYPWLLAPAALLLFGLLLGRRPARTGVGLGMTAALLLALVVLPDLARADGAGPLSALRALQAGDYEGARRRYREQAGFDGRFGEGVSCYRLGDFDCARLAFAEAAWLAGDRETRGRAVFNLANSRFQLGDYQRAMVLYRDAIRQGVAVAQARSNLAFTRELVKEMARLADVRGEGGRRPGRGARSAGLAEGLIPPPGAELSLSDVPLPAGPVAVDQADFDALVQRGLARLQLRETERAGRRRRGAWAGREDLAASVPGSLIWQRLFEIEEGFPAPLQAPRQRPGMQPW